MQTAERVPNGKRLIPDRDRQSCGNGRQVASQALLEPPCDFRLRSRDVVLLGEVDSQVVEFDAIVFIETQQLPIAGKNGRMRTRLARHEVTDANLRW